MPALIFDQLAALSDVTRCRMLLLLEGHELTVSELCGVLQLPQSTVSRHLKTLLDEAWVTSRRDGTNRFYALALEAASNGHARLWKIVREEIAGAAAAAQDRRRLQTILARRKSRSQEFFASAAAQWDRLRADLFGETFSRDALLGLLSDGWVVGDLGCGTGEASGALAPIVRRVIAVDGSAEMLRSATRRLRDFDNVELRKGELESLPIEEATLDAAVLMLVLHHVPDPGVVLAEVARVLKPGGRLLITDMLPHDREEYKPQMGHVWLGFSEDQVTRYLAAAGFDAARVRPLPPHPDAKGPALFVASARRAGRRTDN